VENEKESADKVHGCLLGLALGDALCADREGGLPERLLWRLIGRTRQGLRRWTDDTQMTVDLAAHLAREGRIEQDRLAAEFAASYCWSRGYGPGTAAVLKKIRSGAHWRTAAIARYPSGSFGNGAAMRIAPVALFFYDRQEERTVAVEQSSVITHPNPAAIAGAQLVAEAVVCGLHDTEPPAAARALADAEHADYVAKMRLVAELLAADRMPEPEELRQRLGTGSAAVNSCPAAILLGLHCSGKPYAELIAYV
jgi:poly(ADP-ribose) glycohydrolase ARH3